MNDTYHLLHRYYVFYYKNIGTQKGESSLVLSIFFKFFNDGWLIMYSR